MNLAAHELLESAEALRTKAAEIEQHSLFATMCKDPQLKTILTKHQQTMMAAYQQGISFLQGKGVQVTHQAPTFHDHQANFNLIEQAPMAPTQSRNSLSDQTIATLALNAHKTGSMMAMQWANECADHNLRMYHVNGANLCQEMAYEIWGWMSYNGYYQPPTFTSQQMTQMSGMFQPMNQTGNMGMVGKPMPSMGQMQHTMNQSPPPMQQMNPYQGNHNLQ